ncbi:MAG: chemotaxis protein CheA [Myxococcales bacterium]
MEIDYQTILRAFEEEAREHLDSIEGCLVALEAAPADGERLQAAFRAAHTLKGAARCAELEEVAQLAHRLEDAFERLRDGSTRLDGELASMLLLAVDALREQTALSVEQPDAAGTGRPKSFEALDRWLSNLKSSAQPIVPSKPPSEPSPPSRSTEANPSTAASESRQSEPSQPSESSQPHEAAPATAEAEPSARRKRERQTLRVDVEKLDRMLDLMGEIAVARGRLTGVLATGSTGEAARDAHRDADRFYLELQELVMAARMVPLGTAFRPQVRSVRDLAVAQGKQVQLVCEGGEVEVDNAIIEGLRDPLTHLVSNAVAHGIERPDVRRAAGKDPVGTVRLKAEHRSARIVVEVQDDGGGLDEARIAACARERKLCAEPERLSREELLNLVLLPGLSTAPEVTAACGRGVGLDVVHRNVQALHGTLAIESERGKGARFVITLPLTLAIVDGFAVGAGGEIYVLPIESVVECVELPRSEAHSGRASGVLNLRGEPLPYLRLAGFLGVGDGVGGRRQSVVVIRHGDSRAGLAVDSLHGEGQTVIKPLSSLFRKVPGVAGSALLGDGRVALILDVPGVMKAALATLPETTKLAPTPVQGETGAEPAGALDAAQAGTGQAAEATPGLERNAAEPRQGVSS